MPVKIGSLVRINDNHRLKHFHNVDAYVVDQSGDDYEDGAFELHDLNGEPLGLGSIDTFDLAPRVTVERTHPDATLPRYGSNDAAAMDFAAVEDTVVPARGRVLVKTGIKMVIPPGHWINIRSRSGTALKNGIETGAGVIDFMWRKEIGVLLLNHTDEDYQVKKGDRVGQGILQRFERAMIVEGEVPASDRGGFGSTGK